MLKEVMEVCAALDDPLASGEVVAQLVFDTGSMVKVETRRIEGSRGYTDVVTIRIPGSHGRQAGGSAPTMGIIGQLGGVGARPQEIGLVSDADGALAALSAALKLAVMSARGDLLKGDVIVTTHITPNAPMIPHDPVPFMGSPVGMGQKLRLEVEASMEAILSIDTTRGNRLANHRGIAITPTIKQGWILRPSPSLLDILERVTGELPRILPISMPDITPYGNGLYHVNSLMQPATVTTAPVVGIAIKHPRR